jgi:membrane associated rhomboid family serine protease
MKLSPADGLFSDFSNKILINCTPLAVALNQLEKIYTSKHLAHQAYSDFLFLYAISIFVSASPYIAVKINY